MNKVLYTNISVKISPVLDDTLPCYCTDPSVKKANCCKPVISVNRATRSYQYHCSDAQFNFLLLSKRKCFDNKPADRIPGVGESGNVLLVRATEIPLLV